MSFDTTLANLGIGRYGGTPTPTTSPASAATTMDQSDFLTLMTAQLKNQDPFEPVDNTQMVAQMAQFSSLSGISEMNSTLKAISDRLNGTSTGDALSWVGKTVLTKGDVAYPRTDGTLGGTIALGAEASNVTVTIEGPNGALLKTVELGPQPAGALDFEWDGTTDTGEAPGAGPFTIKVGAQTAEGKSVTTETYVWAPVTSVSFDSNGEPILTIPGLGQVSPSAVAKVG